MTPTTASWTGTTGRQETVFSDSNRELLTKTPPEACVLAQSGDRLTDQRAGHDYDKPKLERDWEKRWTNSKF
jgi:hypothetical protein